MLLDKTTNILFLTEQSTTCPESREVNTYASLGEIQNRIQMYRGFNVTLKTYDELDYQVGLNLFKEMRISTIKQLDKYVGVNGVINGSELENDWFGEINSHIFISHSHTDERLAIALAGYLFKNHKIKCFVDSCVWGYSNELLKQIDNRYCKNADSNTYNYDTRNFSTSHVHMMLSAALNKMIGKCESLFLINSPNSIETSDILKETYSPWIYSEILTSKLIEKKIPTRHIHAGLEHRREIFSKAENLNESLKIKYKLDLDHLVDLSEKEITDWSLMNSKSPEDALDILYGIKPAPQKH